MRFSNPLVAVLAAAGTSAVVLPPGNTSNPTLIADTASRMGQKYFSKDHEYKFNVASEGLTAATLAIISANNRNFTVADVNYYFGITHAIQSRDVAATAVTDPDDWRYFHYEGLRTMNTHWWRGGGAKIKEIKAAHDLVVTPTLPIDILVPKPFLPTSDAKVLALYVLALDQFAAEERKGMSEKMNDLARKKKNMADFNERNVCVHDKNFCHDTKFRDAPAASGYCKKYKKAYTKIFGELKQEMVVAGLVELGGQLKEFMAQTGQKVEMY